MSISKRDRGAPAAVWPALHPTTQAAFNEILWKRGLPRVEVARILRVSRTRLTAITKDLEDHGLVSPGRLEQRFTTGRPAELLIANVDRFHFLGIHIAGGEAVAAVVDLANEVVRVDRHPLPSATPAAIEALTVRLVRQAGALGHRVAGVAICPERPPEGGAAGLDLTRFPDRLVVEADSDADPVAVPVWVDDDVNALTAFEQWPRLRPGQQSMVLIAVGSEVRLGLIADEKIVTGAHGAVGRIAHLLVDPDGPVCPHGHRGCLWSLTAEAVLVAAVPGAHRIRDVAERASSGDAAAEAVLRSAARGLGLASGTLSRLFDPDRLVFTGESASILRGREAVFDAALAASLGAAGRAEVDVAEPDSVEWAQAAGALAQYRTFSLAAS